MYGKAGIALTLFELAKYLNSEQIENHAFNLLQEILTYNIKNDGFSHGKAGMAFTLQYLIKYCLLDADYAEIYGEKHKNIIEKISALEYNEYETADYIDYLFFIENSDYISKCDYEKSQKILAGCIYKTMEKFNKKMKPDDFSFFYSYSSRLLYISTWIREKEIHIDFFNCIEQIREKLVSNDICEDPLFALHFYLYGAVHKEEDIMQKGKEMINNCMKNISPVTLTTLRQRIDAIVCVFKIYTFDRTIDYRNVAYEIFNSMTDSDIVLFERKIARIIHKGKNLDYGLGFGFSRLLILLIYWDQMLQGIFIDNIEKLLI
jgi:hypothetical protein